MSSKNTNPLRNYPDPPIWLIILAFISLPPLGILLLIYKILRDSQPDPKRWQDGANRVRQTSNTTVRQNTSYDVRPDKRSDRSQGQPAQQAGQPVRPPVQRKFPYVKLRDGKVWTITGAIIALIFGIGAVSVAADWGFAYPLYILEDALVPLIFAGGGIGMVIWGMYKTRQTRKFKRYLARISNEPLIPLRPLAQSMSVDMDEVCDTLQRMIDIGVFGDRAYLDLAAEVLVVDNTVAKPAPKAAPVSPEAELSSEDQILRQIRDANDRIPGEEISRKIDRIEEITRHILQYLKKHPERSGELHTFLDYYLPTTLKMLNTYAELDAQKLDGENIAVTKARIEQILDKVVEGFELQLDKLFEGEMLDISSDIDVMEKMLQRDGLSGEMRIPKAPAAPEKAGGYTPSLTLDPEGGTAAQQAPKNYDW